MRIDKEGTIDDIIMPAHDIISAKKKNTRKKDVVKLNIVAFDLIGLLPTNHVIPYITMVYQRKQGNAQWNEETLNVNSKIAQTRQNVGNFTVRQLSLQEMSVLCSNSFVFAPECWKCTLRGPPSTPSNSRFQWEFFPPPPTPKLLPPT